MNNYLFIVKIWQINTNTFAIHWSNGQIHNFCLHDVQRNCPCAGCQQPSKPLCSSDVQAKLIRSVGRYGLHIQFTSGCSKGIYHFDQLYAMHKNENDLEEI